MLTSDTVYDKSTAALVTGIIGLFIPLLGIFAIVYGNKTMKAHDAAKDNGEGDPMNIKGMPVNRGRAKIGMILGIVSLSFMLIALLLTPYNSADASQIFSCL